MWSITLITWLYYFKDFLFFSKKGGDLESKIKKAKNENKPFSVEVIEEWSKQLITGLEFIHRHNITHRDIKPAFEI